MNPSYQSKSGQPGVPDSDAGRLEAPRTHKPNNWTVCIPAAAIDARTAPRGRNGRPISGAKRRLLEVLEILCRGKAYCWPKNETLAAMLGSDVRRTKRLIEGLEADGFLTRVQSDGRKPVRLGVILFNRFDPRLPVATPETLPDIVAELEAVRSKKQGKRRAPDEHSRGVKSTPLQRGKKYPPPEGSILPPRSIRNSERNEVETPSSSKTIDDDNFRFATGEAIESQARESIEVARLCFGANVAQELQDEAGRYGKAIAGRWDLYPAAICQAEAQQAKGTTLDNPLRYAAGIVANDFVDNGIPAEARRARERIEAKAREREAADRRAAEAEAAAAAKAEALFRGIETADAETLIERANKAGWTLRLVQKATADDGVIIQPERYRPDVILLPQPFADRIKAIRSEVVAELRLTEQAAEACYRKYRNPPKSAVPPVLMLPCERKARVAELLAQPKHVPTPEELAEFAEKKRQAIAAFSAANRAQVQPQSEVTAR